MTKHIEYICINCKKEWIDELPPQKSNECISGYYHTFVKKKDLIRRDIIKVIGVDITKQKEKLERVKK